MSTEAAPTNPALAKNDPPAPEQVQTKAEPQAPPAPKPGDVGTPEWLNPRLDQAKRSARADLLKELGVDDPETVKKAIAESKARADAEKTASELLATEKKAREKAEKEAETYRAALATRAEAEFQKLTPEQQAFVEKHAGGDPAKRIATIEDLRLIIKPAPPAPAEAKPEAKVEGAKPPTPVHPPQERKPLPAPASTAPGGASPGGHPPPPVDHLAVLERLDASNPIAAGRYYAKYRAEITGLRAQKSAAAASQ